MVSRRPSRPWMELVATRHTMAKPGSSEYPPPPSDGVRANTGKLTSDRDDAGDGADHEQAVDDETQILKCTLGEGTMSAQVSLLVLPRSWNRAREPLPSTGAATVIFPLITNSPILPGANVEGEDGAGHNEASSSNVNEAVKSAPNDGLDASEGESGSSESKISLGEAYSPTPWQRRAIRGALEVLGAVRGEAVLPRQDGP